MPLFLPFSFRTPRGGGDGGRATVFFGGALLTVPLVLAVNDYLDHKKGKERKKEKEKEKEKREKRSG